VRGLRPVRAARLPTLNVPKPTSVTVEPILSAPLIAPNAPSSAFSAAAFEMSADFATASIISDLFTWYPPFQQLMQRAGTIILSGSTLRITRAWM
jgi:hypothetical protein